jgi:trans-aconitate 2-methyltransferase
MNDAAWDPDKYQQFSDERSRPANDLMDRIPEFAATHIIDLGCGAGDQAVRLAQRWPDATVTAVDSSPTMLDKAREDHGDRVTWIEASIADYDPDQSPDLIYSNAALQWLGDHEILFPKIVGWLKPGGVLAIQMPRNFDAPSHQIMRQVAKDKRWATRLQGVRDASPVATPAEYYEILRPHVQHLDIWETTYTHVLTGADPVAHWTRSTGLRPFLNALDDAVEQELFFDTYTEALRTHYPKQADGKTLFPFQRLFMVLLTGA